MTHHTPPLMLPLRQVPMSDPVTGMVTPAWYRFFVDLCSLAVDWEQITVGPSPFTVKTNHPGNWLIKGVVTQVDLHRQRGFIANVTDPSLTRSVVPVAAGDGITVTYGVLPVMWFIPDGVPA